jgi:hypothetical protein
MGSPPWRKERSQPAIREEQAGLRRVAERSVVARKRVTTVERRGLTFRATMERLKRSAIGHWPGNQNHALLFAKGLLPIQCGLEARLL